MPELNMTEHGALRFLFVLALVLTAEPCVARGQEFEQEPILYSKSQPENRVSQLLGELKTGTKRLEYEEGRGYLRSLLSRTGSARVIANARLFEDEPAA